MVSPFQAVWLDADQRGLTAAEGAGMKAVLVKNVDEVLEKLSDFTGIQVLKEMQEVTTSLANAEDISTQFCWLSQKWINKRKKKPSVGFGLFESVVTFF